MVDLSKGRLSGERKSFSSNENPLEGVANLTDAMLVFACGLLLALMSFWNIDLPTVTEISEQRELTEVTDLNDVTEQLDAEGTTYSELGTVYEDPETGKMYLITEEGKEG